MESIPTRLTWTDWRLSAYHVSSSTLVFRIRESYPFSLFAKSSVLGLTLTGLTFVLDRDPCTGTYPSFGSFLIHPSYWRVSSIYQGIWMEMRLGYGITASTYPIIDLHILTVVILENTHCSEQGPFPVEVMADI
ncbi:hypothetical protein FOPG_05485 [Fusarium oxysporum f. sp. conglutinans race 2 54008]|uniref:Uncharacterized protein n=1 Tax=Fusarium oxysporum f. sp. conglutinans race 2 54008 TaxID=1089457 RepID=X0HXB6_FUSOX|nr:hypothetical protein FOPG_05485 [Fusarium oxysporum f. sp. conglutinans race 2 54008]